MQQTKAMLWEVRILALGVSGLNGQAWSKEQGIPENQVNYWVRKLRPKNTAPESKRWIALPSASSNDTGIVTAVGLS